MAARESENEYMECARQINRAIDEIGNPLTPKPRKNSALSAAQRAMDEAERHIENIERATASLTGSDRTSNMSKVRRFKTDLATLRREVVKTVRGKYVCNVWSAHAQYLSEKNTALGAY